MSPLSAVLSVTQKLFLSEYPSAHFRQLSGPSASQPSQDCKHKCRQIRHITEVKVISTHLITIYTSVATLIIDTKFPLGTRLVYDALISVLRLKRSSAMSNS